MKNFVEFFAGVGLIREGLKPSGWNCIWANDISKDKQETYIDNFGSDDFFLGDIWDLAKTPEVVPDNAFMYTASFPCTDLSVAGGRAGLAGKNSGSLNALIDIIRDKKTKNTAPKVILLENVRGFLTSNQGVDIEKTITNLSDLGYFSDIIELDAIDFSAQSRPRVFIIAVEEGLAQQCMKIKKEIQLVSEWWEYFEKQPYIRSDKIKKIILKNDSLKWALFDIAPPPSSDKRLSGIIETNLPDSSNLWWNEARKNHLFYQMSENHKSVLNEMINSKKYRYGTVYRRMRQGKSMAELRTDGYAGCLRTPRGGSSKQIVIRAGKNRWDARLLTPREYARLQGVRDCFRLPENPNKGYFAMGDAVCVPVIEFISEKILDSIYNTHIQIKNSNYNKTYS